MRDQREASILLEQAAKYIAREAGRSTLITPLRVDLSPDRKNVTIFVSVYPDADAEHALAFLKRHKDLFRNSLKRTARLAVLPYITFELDYGEKNRQRMDELSREAHLSDPEEDPTPEA